MSEPYGVEQMMEIMGDSRVIEYQKVKEIFRIQSIEVTSGEKLKRDIGFMGKNMAHGIIEPVTDIAVTGLCFPDKFNLQSVLPLLVIKDMFDSGATKTAYIAMPVAAYAGARIARRPQYLDGLGIVAQIFGDRLGKSVFIIPDHRDEILTMKAKITMLSSRCVSERPAQAKYEHSNLFRYVETAMYGSDITLAALAEGKSVTTVADYRQFESIHAAVKMTKDYDFVQGGALLLTLIQPRYPNRIKPDRVIDVTQGEIEDLDGGLIPERSPIFYQAACLLPRSEIKAHYQNMRQGKKAHDLQQEVEMARIKILNSIDFSIHEARELEDLSIEKLIGANQLLSGILEDRISNSRYFI